MVLRLFLEVDESFPCCCLDGETSAEHFVPRSCEVMVAYSSTIVLHWKWDVSKISSLNFLGSLPLNHDCGRNRRNIYLHFPLHVGKFHRSCIVNNPYIDPMGKANSWWTHLIPGCFCPALDQLASHVRQVGADLKRTPGDEKQFGMCRRCSSHPCVVSVYIHTYTYMCVCVSM